MSYKHLCLSLGWVWLTACTEPVSTTNMKADYQPVMDTRHTMLWILDPGADFIWDSAGAIITAAGEEDLSPTTDEGWAEVARHAATLAESGNLLMLPGRSAGADWNQHASELIAAGTLALRAAEAQDSLALFAAGGEIYQVCLACHNQYWVVLDDTETGRPLQ